MNIIKKIILTTIILAPIFAFTNFAYAVLKVGAPNNNASLKKGLVGHWTFDGQDMVGATAIDRSGNNNNGTLTNGPVKKVGKIGQALNFDGVDDYVDIGTSFDISSLPFSVSAWIKLSNYSSHGTIFAKRDSWSVNDERFNFTTQIIDGLILFESGSGGTVLTFNYSPPLNNWTHLVIVARSGATDLYANGIFQQTLGAFTLGTDSTASTRIGNTVDGPDQFKGSIDEVRVYNRALSADEIKRLYRMGATLKLNKPNNNASLKKGLVGHWTFDGQDMVGATAIDRSGNNNNNGTLTNGPVKKVGKIGQALNFDGVDDYVSIPDPGTNSVLDFGSGASITLSAWVYPKYFDITAYSTFITKNLTAGINNANYTFSNKDGCTTTCNISFYYSTSVGGDNAYVTNTGILTLNNWQHVAVTYTFGASASIKIYHNGILQTGSWTAGGSNTPTQTNEPIWIGADNYAGGASIDEMHNGLIDEVRVYNRALYADEIKRLYRIGTGLKLR